MKNENLAKDYFKIISEQKQMIDFTINKDEQNKSMFENDKNDLIEKLRHLEKQFNDLTENFEIQKNDLEEQKRTVYIK